jgi:hypothetical protein
LPTITFRIDNVYYDSLSNAIDTRMKNLFGGKPPLFWVTSVHYVRDEVSFTNATLFGKPSAEVQIHVESESSA